jgi:hypothetical protein
MRTRVQRSLGVGHDVSGDTLSNIDLPLDIPLDDALDALLEDSKLNILGASAAKLEALNARFPTWLIDTLVGEGAAARGFHGWSKSYIG